MGSSRDHEEGLLDHAVWSVVDAPQTRFVSSGDVLVGFQSFGMGPDLLVISGGPSHLELRWHLPRSARFHRALARFCRVTMFDRRGIGVSGPSMAHTFEAEISDVLAVLDAAEVDSAYVYGSLDGGALAVEFVAAHPERVRGLIVESCGLRFVSSSDSPFGFQPDEWKVLADAIEAWSIEQFTEFVAPELTSDPQATEVFARYAAAGAGPERMADLMRRSADVDLRDAAPRVSVPALFLARQDDVMVPPGAVRRLAREVPNARFIELPSASSTSDQRFDALRLEIQYFITGERAADPSQRAIATVVLLDLVDSTTRLGAVGDLEWRRTLDSFESLTGAVVAEYRGRVVKFTGDGLLATFASPTDALDAAAAIRDTAHRLALRFRAGIHAGEVELRDNDISGMVVHVAARVEALADSNEVLLTRTVRDLVADGRFRFGDAGRHQLRGIDGEWQLLRMLEASPTGGTRA